MVKITILYPNTKGSWFDDDYYFNKHIPMAIERLGKALRGVTVEHGLGGVTPGSPPSHVAMCPLFFDSIEAFLDAFTPHADFLQGDIPNYTSIEPIIQYSEVRIHK